MPSATYAFSKIFVRNLNAMADFYQKIFGLIPQNHHYDVILGREIEEIIFQPGHAGGGALTLISYADGIPPLQGEAIQGFIASDIDDLIEKALAAGATIEDPVRYIPRFKIKMSIIRDIESNLIELVQQLNDQ